MDVIVASNRKFKTERELFLANMNYIFGDKKGGNKRHDHQKSFTQEISLKVSGKSKRSFKKGKK